jgi:hypothetical protein
MKKLCLLMLIIFGSSITYADQIECTFDVDDTRKTLITHPSKDIYTSTKIDLPGGFRFASQYLSDLKIFKAYVYHTPKKRYVLLTLQSFSLSQASCVQDFGQHRVYDSEDERELYFHCRKTCS